MSYGFHLERTTPSSTGALRQRLSRIVAFRWSGRSDRVQPGPGPRAPRGTGVTPYASGATRGAALFVGKPHS